MLNLSKMTFLVSFMLLSMSSTILAMQNQAPVVEVSGGSIGFLDATESFLGGAARFYMLPRVSLGPEVTYIFGQNHTHLMLTGNVNFVRIWKMNR